MNETLATSTNICSLQDTIDFEQVPVEQRYPWKDTYTLIKMACEKFGDDHAVEFLPTAAKDEASFPVTYTQLLARLHQTANLFNSLGVASKDAVSIMLPTLPQTIYAIWGAQAAGIASPLNPMLEPRHLAEIIDVTGSEIFVAMAPMTGAPYLWESTLEVLKLAKGLKHLVVITLPGLTGEVEGDIPDHIQITDYTQAIEQQNPASLDSQREFNGSDIACFMHTGGTTGRPKVAQLTHSNFAFVGQITVDRTEDKPRENVLGALPMFHIFGLIVSGIASIMKGNNIIIMSPGGYRQPNLIANIWHHVERFKFNNLAVVPTILAAMHEIPLNGCDVSSLKEVLSGAAPLPLQLKKNFEERFDCTVVNGYGMTETTVVLSISSVTALPPEGGVGLRVPYTERIIAHVDNGKITKVCANGETGVVLSRGPNIFAGYLEEAHNQSAWADGWFNTGDMGYQDDDGFLFLVGRAKDLIIRGGHNIDPVVIEEPLEKHPDIAQVVAVGQPDDYAGELPVVYITLAPGADYNAEAMASYAQREISERAAVPKRIEVIDEIPLTAVGKIYKPELRRRATEFALNTKLNEHKIKADISVIHDTEKGLQSSIEIHDKAQMAAAQTALQGFAIAYKLQ